MFKIIQFFAGLIHETYERHADPRVADLPLVGNLWPVFAIIAAYLAFVFHYGPKWMKNREPFDLKNIMKVYNAIQVVANIYIFYVGLRSSYLSKDFSFTCQPIDTTNRQPHMLDLVKATYWYYLTKYLDLLDTVFFVLRKKTNQITFLHVYHHAGMVVAVCIHTTFLAGSHATMLGVINLFVHSIMYSYYFATSMNNSFQTLWWKRHITEMQLLQFGYLMVHFFIALVKKDCTHPGIIAAFGLIQNFFMFMLFFDFYYKAYIRKSKKSTASGDNMTTSKPLQDNAKRSKLKSS